MMGTDAFVWSEESVQAFEQLKWVMVTLSELALANFLTLSLLRPMLQKWG